MREIAESIEELEKWRLEKKRGFYELHSPWSNEPDRWRAFAIATEEVEETFTYAPTAREALHLLVEEIKK